MNDQRTVAHSSSTRRAGSSRSGPSPCLLSLLVLAITTLGCASFPVDFTSTGDRSASVARPDLEVDYDVLVAEMALGDGDYFAARRALERATRKDPDSPYLEKRLSRIEAHLENLIGAIEHGERAVELAPEDEEARMLLGGLFRLSRNVEGAERALLESDGTPISDKAALLLYQIYFETDRLDEARAITEYLVANRPEMLGGFMALATIYERLGKPAQAERVLRQALEEHPDRFVLYSLSLIHI